MKLEVCDAGQMEFSAAYRLQCDWVERRLADPDGQPDRLLLVEHQPPVYTLGRNASSAYVRYDAQQRAALGLALVQTDRGGQVTYHGPGQITGYPIVRLSTRRGRGVAWYVHHLEEMLIRTLAHFGITANRDTLNPGVWVGQEKIAAIGVRVRRQITMHGFGLNVCVNLDHYAGIVPCGIKTRGVTSMHVGCPDIRTADVLPVLRQCFGQVFGYTSEVSYAGEDA